MQYQNIGNSSWWMINKFIWQIVPLVTSWSSRRTIVGIHEASDCQLLQGWARMLQLSIDRDADDAISGDQNRKQNYEREDEAHEKVFSRFEFRIHFKKFLLLSFLFRF